MGTVRDGAPDAVVRLSGIVGQSIVDGPGLRMAVFTQGCRHNCPGCHNPGTHAFGGGTEWSVASILERFDGNPLLAGVTLSGGEPMLQAPALAPLAEQVKRRGKNVWCYTGFTFEELLEKKTASALLPFVDVLVDGRFDIARRSLALPWRGSANQRVLDLRQSLEKNRAVLLKLREECCLAF